MPQVIANLVSHALAPFTSFPPSGSEPMGLHEGMHLQHNTFSTDSYSTRKISG